MADPALIAEGLARLAGSVDGLPLLASRAASGAFASSKQGKEAAAHCQQLGLVRALSAPASGRSTNDAFTLTEAGIAWLRNQSSARPTLDIIAQALAERTKDVEGLQQQLADQQDRLHTLSLLVETLAERAREATTSIDAGTVHEAMLLHELREWQSKNPLKDCCLPTLFRAVRVHATACTIGAFHDACRRLSEKRRIYLHAWTGPLYEMPEPALAFLFGHEIAYYASLREPAERMVNGAPASENSELLAANSHG